MGKQELLDELKEREKNDPDLPLKDTASHLVFGHGSVDAKILFLGEAPGKNEDAQALPFVGAAGKILDQLLKSINLSREDIFISSVVHYRPPRNRQPEPSEIEAFSKYVDEMIEIIDPKIIATLGNFSLNKFLHKAKISEIHGTAQEIDFKGKKRIIIPLYHPAAVFYKRTLEKILEKDFKVIRQTLDSLNS